MKHEGSKNLGETSPRNEGTVGSKRSIYPETTINSTFHSLKISSHTVIPEMSRVWKVKNISGTKPMHTLSNQHPHS